MSDAGISSTNLSGVDVRLKYRSVRVEEIDRFSLLMYGIHGLS